MEERIINSQEIRRKFFNYTGQKFYVYNSIFKAEEVFIDRVVVVQDHTTHPKNTTRGASRGVIGAILAGIVGVAIASISSQTRWDADLDLYLADGRVIEIRTQSPKLIRELLCYVPKMDPRLEYREGRKKNGN